MVYHYKFADLLINTGVSSISFNYHSISLFICRTVYERIEEELFTYSCRHDSLLWHIQHVSIPLPQINTSN
ncbi:MAG: hypothetical protein UU81_C0001G0002 [Microgenomates group bacterium GW2011_GWC1_41_8]|nr:MAG: hypothetical protein UU81_C0001G0002 [Microgenomates group bacterium GW2011_GWC1_41_8]